MVNAHNISSGLIDSLYEDALQMADDVRRAFDPTGDADFRPEAVGQRSPAYAALAAEALRTNTRLMHMLTWLLNQRAYFAGEMSEVQLRRSGRMPEDQPQTDPSELHLLDENIVRVVEETRQFYARIARIDADWRDQHAPPQRIVHHLHDLLGRAFTAS